MTKLFSILALSFLMLGSAFGQGNPLPKASPRNLLGNQKFASFSLVGGRTYNLGSFNKSDLDSLAAMIVVSDSARMVLKLTPVSDTSSTLFTQTGSIIRALSDSTADTTQVAAAGVRLYLWKNIIASLGDKAHLFDTYNVSVVLSPIGQAINPTALAYLKLKPYPRAK